MTIISSGVMQVARYRGSVTPWPRMKLSGDRNMNAQNARCRNGPSCLFMSDSFYRIHVGGFLGWYVAKEHTDKHTYKE